MKNKMDMVRHYLAISEKVADLESKKQSARENMQCVQTEKYTNLKLKIKEYRAKVDPTLKIVCDLYSDIVKLQGGVLYLHNKATQKKYTAINAYNVALEMAAQSIGFLSAVLKKRDIEQNLEEFAIRYNTLLQIFNSSDNLALNAVQEAMVAYDNEITELKKEQECLFKTKENFNAVVDQLIKLNHSLCQKAIINDKIECEKNFVTEISIPLGAEVCDGEAIGNVNNGALILSLFEWKLHQENGILVIRAKREYFESERLSVCIVDAAIRFLFAYPSANKCLLLCDCFSDDTITAFAGVLSGKKPEMFFNNVGGSFVKNTSEDLRESFSELNNTVNRRIMLLGQSNCNDILDYNQKNPDNPIPLIFVAVNGYSMPQYDSVHEHISALLKNGKRAGVYFLIIEVADFDESAGYFRQSMPKTESITNNIVYYDEKQGQGYLSKDGINYLADLRGDRFDLQSLLSVFEVSHEKDSRKIVDLESVIGSESFNNSPRRKLFSKTLSVPFGKNGADFVGVDLVASGLGAHMAVIGSTGSGKTAFMNTLILSMCSLYSPSELELHLIVMVKGGFKIFEEEQLPHLKTIVTGDRIFAANDVLDYIDEEMKRREKLIGSYENIYTYNDASGHLLPRWVILIDEFYQLIAGNDEAIDRITKIAQTGRAYGISLVVCSTNFPMEIHSLIPLFGNRVEFKAEENAGQLIPEVTNRQSELDKGRCFFAHDGMIQFVAVAFSGEGNELKQRIKKIKSKFSNSHMEIRNDVRTVKISSESDVPFGIPTARRKYEVDGVIRARCGTTYLTNKNLEYSFNSTHNVLFLLGNYLDTKMVEASLIKDVFVLSKEIKKPTVYYLDYNKNASLKRAKTVIKRLLESWAFVSGKMQYSGSDGADDIFEDIGSLISQRETDEESELFPVLVVISKADEILEDQDSDVAEELVELISRGKETNVYFVIQCSEPRLLYSWQKIVKDAIVFPDRYSEDDPAYTSDMLCTMLDELPAGATDKGRKLIANARKTPLSPKLHLLCVDNQITVFVPYDYDEEYLKNIIN